MKVFDRNASVLSVSHGDFDGIVSQIVLGNVFKNIEYVTAEFYTINQKMQVIEYDKYDYVFITDIHPDKETYLDLADNIVLIDHHPSEFNNPKKNRFVVSDKNKCAAYLVKYFFEKMYGDKIDLSHLNDLVRYANDYDIWEKKYAKSTFINEMYKGLYDTDDYRNRFMNGDVRLTQEECEFIRKQKDMFDEVYNNLPVFEFDSIRGCVCIADSFVNDVADRLLKTTDYRVVIVRNPAKGRSSIRHNVPEFDAGKLLEQLGYGGGHQYAAGMFERDEDMFRKKAAAIEEEIVLMGIGAFLI